MSPDPTPHSPPLVSNQQTLSPIERVLSGLGAGPARQGAQALAEMKSIPGEQGRDCYQAWQDLAKNCATLGLSTISPKEATRLLADLLPYPIHSRARQPGAQANSAWLDQVRFRAGHFALRAGHASWAALTPSRPSPYPLLFCAARIEALGAKGADPVKSKALLRATFRKNAEEIEAALGLPGCPSPGTPYERTTSPLHRACYQGPNDIFAMLARASSESDWLARDSSGLLPLDKAYQSSSLGRAVASARLTPLLLAGSDYRGDTPMHRLASHLAGKGDDFDPESSGWLKALCDMALALGPDVFCAKNKAGLTPIDLARFPDQQRALLERHALSTRDALADIVSPEASSHRSHPKSRL